MILVDFGHIGRPLLWQAESGPRYIRFLLGEEYCGLDRLKTWLLSEPNPVRDPDEVLKTFDATLSCIVISRYRPSRLIPAFQTPTIGWSRVRYRFSGSLDKRIIHRFAFESYYVAVNCIGIKIMASEDEVFSISARISPSSITVSEIPWDQ